MYRRTGLGFTLLTLFLAGCIYLLSVGQINLGLDLKGGTELSYQLDLSLTENPDELATNVKDILQRRLNAYGLRELSIAIQGDDRLVVQVPGGDPETVSQLRNQIEQAGTLEFRLVASQSEVLRNIAEYERRENEYNERLRAYFQRLQEHNARRERDPNYTEPPPNEPTPPEYVVRQLERRNPDTNEVTGYEPLVLVNRPGSWVDGRYINAVAMTLDEYGKPAVAFQMTGEGAEQLGDLTGQNVKEQMAIVLDNVVVSAPTIQSRISTNGQITGNFSQEEIKGLITVLRGGSLPTKPRLLSESVVGSTLGVEAIEAGMQAVLIGILGVVILMAAYYLAAGLVANFAIVFNVIVVLAFVVVFRQDLTLPGIAGLLLSIGMAVDANILIYERVREERKRGKGLVQALTIGYQRAFSVILDSNLTTLITGVVLFNFGTGPIKGFAVTLIAGIIVSFFSALFVTKLLLSFLVNRGWVKRLHMVQAFEPPNFSYIRWMRPFAAASIIFIVASMALVFARGDENYGIDFTGGARVRMRLADPLSRDVVEQRVEAIAEANPELFRDRSLQTIGAVDGEGRAREFAILTRAGSARGNTAEAQAAPAGENAPASDPSAAPALSAGSATLADEAGSDPAQLVRVKLEEVFREELLPEPFPGEPTWRNVDGLEAMSLLVNLMDVHAAVDAAWIRTKLDERLAADPKFSSNAIRVADVRRTAVREGDLSVATFEVELQAFTPASIARADAAPTRSEAATKVRSFFRSPPPFNAEGVSPFQISDPFPQVSTVGPRVASDLQEQAVVALFISILGIIFYLSLRYEFIFGLAGIVALVHDVLVSLGCMAIMDVISERFLGGAIPIKLNLPEMAALLTTIGYSINDTIVVFDRIRENWRGAGKKRDFSFRECIDLSINQTLSRTLLTAVTTFLTIAALLFFGGEAIRGFAFIFLVGLVAGTYSSIFIAAPFLFVLWQRNERRRTAEPAKAGA